MEVPEFEPAEIADALLGEFDANGDDLLETGEISSLPGLLSSLTSFDRNGDRRISGDEVATEFREWLDNRTGLLSIRCKVNYRGKPLVGATVRLIPEAYLAEVVPEASGVTNALGITYLSCAAEHLPAQLSSFKAMMPGIYRVEVTHPEKSLPAKYNTETTLGRTVSRGNSHPLSLDL